MNKIILMALTLCGCGTAREEPPLAGARIGGPFTLIDENGRSVTNESFGGKYRIMYFGYTFCPDVCPTDVATLMRGYRAFAKADPADAAKVQPIFVSVDPARDTPAVVRAFTDAFDPALIGLTGTPAAVAAVAKGFGVAYSVQKTPGASQYLVDHSRVAYLMDPAGKPIALLSHDAAADVIAAELDKWVT